MISTPTPIPTLPISIYPETWQKANDSLNQAIGIGFDEIAIGIFLVIVLASSITFLVRKFRRS